MLYARAAKAEVVTYSSRYPPAICKHERLCFCATKLMFSKTSMNFLLDEEACWNWNSGIPRSFSIAMKIASAFPNRSPKAPKFKAKLIHLWLLGQWSPLLLACYWPPAWIKLLVHHVCQQSLAVPLEFTLECCSEQSKRSRPEIGINQILSLLPQGERSLKLSAQSSLERL